MSKIKAVIFDLDGTLIDTEKYYRVNWPKAMANFGYNMTDEQALYIRSLGKPFAPAKFKEWFGEDFDYEKVRAYRKILMDADLEKYGIELKPGCVEILTYLREHGFITAIATANDLERTKKYVEKIGLSDYFDRLISAHMVKEGKPSPDIYEYACMELGILPSEAIAVEDSPNGIISAYKAGCNVIMVPDQSEPDDEIKKMLYGCVSSLEEITKFLE